MAVGDGRGVGAVTGDSSGSGHALRVANPLGYDVDDPQEGAGHVKRRVRAPNHFHPVDQIDVNWKVRPDRGLVIHVVVDAVAIHQQQESAVVVAWTTEATNPNVAIVAVVIHVEARHMPQHVGQGAVTV